MVPVHPELKEEKSHGHVTAYRLLAPGGLLAVGAIALAGCAEGDSGGSGSGSEGNDDRSYLRGITGSEADLLNQSFDQFTKDTGIKVEYTGDKSFGATS